MRNYEEQAKMLGTQFPVMIGLLVMEKELRKVFQTYDNYLQYVEQPDLLQDFPMAQRYRRRCVAHVHIQVIKTIQVLVTKGVNANSGELSPITVSRQQSFKSEYLLITI
jgi:hypothetical protein